MIVSISTLMSRAPSRRGAMPVPDYAPKSAAAFAVRSGAISIIEKSARPPDLVVRAAAISIIQKRVTT